MDATKIQVAEFWKVKGCPLAAALRRKFRHSKNFPSKKFKCVFSEELLQNKDTLPLPMNDSQKRPNGTVAHATAIFGFMLAGMLIQDIYEAYSAKQ
jgi:tRNA A37 threonylcarbamoyladenosine dehydratase